MIEDDIYTLHHQMREVAECFEQSSNFDELKACILSRIKPDMPFKYEPIRQPGGDITIVSSKGETRLKGEDRPLTTLERKRKLR